jgi:hypothetical protein
VSGASFHIVVDSDDREAPLLRLRVTSGGTTIPVSSNDEVEIHRLVAAFSKAVRFLDHDD